FFFFQAEDGIRDLTVTGVQTCALPISAFPETLLSIINPSFRPVPSVKSALNNWVVVQFARPKNNPAVWAMGSPISKSSILSPLKIGRASCRERVRTSVVGVSSKQIQIV